jgi:hypothetical protein
MPIIERMKQPTFIIAGAMRAGTTSLTRWLDGHPEVFMAPSKEVHYFDINYSQGPDWYALQFAAARNQPEVGEATPNYLYDPLAMDRIAHDLPDIRLIITLRDPVERAYSHYWHRRSRGGENLSFEQAISVEPERLKQGDQNRAHFSYIDRGRYLAQVARVVDLFQRSSLLFLRFDDVRDRPSQTFTTISRFLRIDHGLLPDTVGTHANRFQEFRSLRLRRLGNKLPAPVNHLIGRLNRVDVDKYPPMSPYTRRELAAQYAGERAELQRLTGLDLSTWT